MHLAYNILIALVQGVLPVSRLFNTKMRQFVSGRKRVYDHLERLDKTKPTVWFHAASLGEYEQGAPVMEAIQEQYPDHQLLVTFFSPSGYEIKKNNAFAKATTYLPLDTQANAQRFLSVAKPDLAIFIKYEFWPNYLFELQDHNIPTILLSGIFDKRQAFFKWYGKWMVSALNTFDHFFVQDKTSERCVNILGFDNVTVSGDTRFDRVSAQLAMDNSLDIMEAFKADRPCVVCGSTWPEDEALLCEFINSYSGTAKFVIAPHQIHEQHIDEIIQRLQLRSLRYSQWNMGTIDDYTVLILDSIGQLSRCYSYADLAYVGGAKGTTGLHNILEPATFGIPIVTGSHIERFPEAQRLRQLAGLYTVKDQKELDAILNKLLGNATFREQTGMISGHFVNNNTGATQAVMKYLTDTYETN